MVHTFMLLLNAIYWLFPTLIIEGRHTTLSGQLISSLNPNLSNFSWWQKLGGIILSNIPLVALSGGLLNLRALFISYSQGEYFSSKAANFLEKVGHAVLFWVILNFLCEPLLSAWITMFNPNGHRMISLSFDSSSIVALFLAACTSIVARIMRQASELDTENQQFV